MNHLISSRHANCRRGHAARRVASSLLLPPAIVCVLACASCGESSPPNPPPPPVTDSQPVGEGLKVIGFAVLGAAVVSVLGRMLK